MSETFMRTYGSQGPVPDVYRPTTMQDQTGFKLRTTTGY